MKLLPRGRHLLCGLLTIGTLCLAGCRRPTDPSNPAPPAPADPAKASPTKKQNTNQDVPGTDADWSLVEDTWEASFIGATKVGHNHTVVHEAEVEGRSLRRTKSEQVLRLSRGGDVAEQRLVLESVESADGVESMTSEMTSQDVTVRTDAKVEDNILRLSLTTTGREPEVLKQPWPPGTMGYFGLYQSLAAKPMKPTETRELNSLMPAVNQIASIQLTAGKQWEEVQGLTDTQQALPIEAVLVLGETRLRQTIWMNQQGQVASSYDPQVRLRTYQTTRELALAESDGVFEFDDTVFIKATGKSLNMPHGRQRAVYLVTVDGENPAKLFPSSDTQRVRAVGPNQAELVVVKPQGPAPTLSDLSTEEDLNANALIQSDDAEVRKLAASVAADKTDPMAIAVALERLVHEKVEQKDYSRAFDSAADVARKLQGDCTEHSVLLAALCRARGIPARVVSGLVAFRDGFAYHMWTEIWVGNAWAPLDATLGRGGIGVGHIKLVDSNLAGANSFAALLPVLQVIGRLKIHVQDVQ